MTSKITDPNPMRTRARLWLDASLSATPLPGQTREDLYINGMVAFAEREMKRMWDAHCHGDAPAPLKEQEGGPECVAGDCGEGFEDQLCPKCAPASPPHTVERIKEKAPHEECACGDLDPGQYWADRKGWTCRACKGFITMESLGSPEPAAPSTEGECETCKNEREVPAYGVGGPESKPCPDCAGEE